MERTKRALQRKRRVRSKIFGTKTRPRLSVFRSNKYIYGVLIDDEDGKTLVSVGDKKLGKEVKTDMTKSDRARLAGKKLAELARKKKISKVVFDRGPYKYLGRIKAYAEGAREGGLKF